MLTSMPAGILNVGVKLPLVWSFVQWTKDIPQEHANKSMRTIIDSRISEEVKKYIDGEIEGSELLNEGKEEGEIPQESSQEN